MFVDLDFSLKNIFLQKNPKNGFYSTNLFYFSFLSLSISLNKFIKAQIFFIFELFFLVHVNYCKQFFSNSNFYFEKRCY